MVKQIVRDVFFLGQPSEPATKADIQVGKDLQDTLQANRERCHYVVRIVPRMNVGCGSRPSFQRPSRSTFVSLTPFPLRVLS